MCVPVRRRRKRTHPFSKRAACLAHGGGVVDRRGPRRRGRGRVRLLCPPHWRRAQEAREAAGIAQRPGRERRGGPCARCPRADEQSGERTGACGSAQGPHGGCRGSPDGRLLATTSSDRTLRLWLADEASLSARDHVVRRVNIQLDTPLQVVFTAEGKLLLGMESGSVRRLALLAERAADGSWTKQEAEFALGHKEAPRAVVSLSAPFPAVLSCGGGTVVRLHSPTGTELASYDTHQVECYSVAASADGRYVAAASWAADVNVLEVDGGKGKPPRLAPAFALPGHRRAVRAVAFSAAGHVVTASADGTARLYKLRRPGEDPALIVALTADAGAAFQLAAFSPDGGALALGEGKSVLLVRTESGKLLRRWVAHDANVVSVAWSPDGKLLASAGDGERNAKVWRSEL